MPTIRVKALLSLEPLYHYAKATAVSEEAAGPTNFGLTSLCMVLEDRLGDQKVTLPDNPSGSDIVEALRPLRSHVGGDEFNLKMFDDGLNYLKKISEFKRAA